MPDEEVVEATIYHEKLSEIVDVPPPDELVQGSYVASEIQISAAGTYKRGELMMSSGSNVFVTATSAGLASASEICILSRDITVPSGEIAYAAGFFTGTFSPDSIVLSYEQDSDDHAELIGAVKEILRRRSIFFN